MKLLVAFRCQDGTYVLVPHAASRHLFDNPSVEFLGDVRDDSFPPAVALKIEQEILRWNFALISTEQFHFAWSRAQSPSQDQAPPQRASSPPRRKRQRRRQGTAATH